jgi:hypothetical protein
VSLVRIKRLVGDVQQHALLDSQVLFRAMSLISHGWSRDESISKSGRDYESVKIGLVQCEDCSLITLNTLAARILLCFYEIGHGLYPAAYLTAGICVRLAFVLGIHDGRAVQLLPKAGKFLIPNCTEAILDLKSIDTWTENEERRRLWWATIIADRFAFFKSFFTWLVEGLC